MCKCDHPARSQVKIGALFILLGPVILTKKQPGKFGSRAGGRRGRRVVRKSRKDMEEIIQNWLSPL